MIEIDYKKIYKNAFSVEGYNLHNDQEFRFSLVKKFVEENNCKSVIDLGSGRGNVIRILNEINPDIEVTSCDLEKFHSYECEYFNLNLCDTESFSVLNGKSYNLLTCLDVLEHVDKSCVDNIFKLFQKLAEFAVITIANHSDKLNGVQLHTIREDMTYWKPIIEKYFEITYFDTQYNGRLYLLTLKRKK